MNERYTNRWTVGDWTFYQIEDHGFSNHDGPMFAYGVSEREATRQAGKPITGEWYPNLEHAMAAAIAEKFTGKRGAGGTGVGTAADWFMRMIGAYEVTPVERPDHVLTGALSHTDSYRGPLFGRSHRMADWLAARGLTIARVRNGG